MSRIQLDLPGDLADQVDKKFGAGASRIVAQAAFREWAAWLLAESRPLSLSEMEIARVYVLYRDVFTGELPSAAHLSAHLQLPIARCRYIAQSLGYQYPSFLRSRLLNVLQQAYGAIKQDGDIYVMDVQPECGDLLDSMLNQIADSAGLAELRGKKHGAVTRYELTSGYFQRLGKAIESAAAPAVDGA